MKLKLLASLLFLAPAGLSVAGEEIPDNVTRYVDPFVGSTNFGTTNPGAVCPNGLMSVSPFNVMGSNLNVWDKDSRWWSTPYCFENKFFTGYSHVNLSGVGCPELGALLVMPTAGPLQVDYHIYGSEYSDEYAEPGYYSNVLSAYGIRTEVSATTRTSAERFTFPAGESHILLNLGEGLTNETGAMVRKVSDTEIEGMRLLGTFCYNPQAVFPMYFVMRVSKTPVASGYWKKQRVMTGVEAEWTPDNGKYKIYTRYGREMAGDDIGYWFTFETEEGEQVEVQMGVSFVSIENARENLEAEQKGFDFDAVRAQASARWERDLSKIRVSGGTEDQKTVFYTGLYHALIHPNILNDVNGEYPLMENDGVGTVPEGQNRYTVFSLWDTYRNVHQLMTLLYPDRQLDMVRSMIGIYKEWGWMPKWELYGRETFTMEGDPAIPVIADTWFKGLKDFDIETAYQAFIKSATTPGAQNRMRPDVDPYIERGYIPLGVFAADLSGDNAVSHALEYYIADHALSLLADSILRQVNQQFPQRNHIIFFHIHSSPHSFQPQEALGRNRNPGNGMGLPRDQIQIPAAALDSTCRFGLVAEIKQANQFFSLQAPDQAQQRRVSGVNGGRLRLTGENGVSRPERLQLAEGGENPVLRRSRLLCLPGCLPVHLAPVKVAGIRRLVRIVMVAVVIELPDFVSGIQNRDAGQGKHIGMEHDHRVNGPINLICVPRLQRRLQSAQGSSRTAQPGISRNRVFIV